MKVEERLLGRQTVDDTEYQKMKACLEEMPGSKWILLTINRMKMRAVSGSMGFWVFEIMNQKRRETNGRWGDQERRRLDDDEAAGVEK